jgi:invasion protein IalB
MLAAAIGFAGLAGSVEAQTAPAAKKDEKKAAPPAKKAPAAAPAAKAEPAAAAGNASAWVKLCRKSPIVQKGPDGKPASEEREVCSTQQEHRALDGRVRLSASVMQMQGADKMQMSFVVPLGVILPPGLSFAIVNKEEVEKLSKGEALEDGKVQFVRAPFVVCFQGCSAELEATGELVAKMKASAGILVRVVQPTGQAADMFLTLQGFGETFDGKPYDLAKYQQGLMQQTQQVRQARQEEILRQDPELAALVKQREDAEKALEEQQKLTVQSNPKLAEAIEKMKQVQGKLLEHAQSKQQHPPGAEQPPATTGSTAPAAPAAKKK